MPKIDRVIDRELPGASRETLLILDSTTGQNAVIQAREFKESAAITGLVLTKLDGTAKGGAVFSIKKMLELDGVKLSFEKEAIEAIAAETVTRKTGARGLRAIMEHIMMDTMYEVPSDESVTNCVITKRSRRRNGEVL